VSACGNLHDTGRVAGTVPEKDSIPKGVGIYTVTVEKNKSVRVIWQHYPMSNFYRYFLYRKDNNLNANYKLYQVIKNRADTSFLDSDVNVQAKSYCYKIQVESQCGIFSATDYGCSILLSGTSIPFEHNLSWNPYMKWADGVNRYDVYRRDPSKADSMLNSTSAVVTQYKDDSLDYDQGLYWYHVVGRSSLDPKAASSVSNEIELIQKPILYVPNAFTPNSDDRNDKWLAVPVFVKDYHMHVYNRWGEYIWHADKKHELWDGVFKGAPASNDVFIWQVEYTGWDGSHNFRHGYVTTLP
jgi:gliding motility-associated-like protein